MCGHGCVNEGHSSSPMAQEFAVNLWEKTGCCDDGVCIRIWYPIFNICVMNAVGLVLI